MEPLVSVVIPTFNRARDLERALKSVLAQTCPRWEALVVDNHSSDNTDEVVKAFGDPRIRLLKIHNNGVIAASRNLGIRHALGEYIAFLDSDDWWLPRKLEESLKYLDQGSDVVYHDLFMVYRAGQRIFWRKVRARALGVPAFQDLLVNGNALITSSVVARKSILLEIGGLSEDTALISWEDYDAWLRAARITDKFRKLSKPLGYYWRGGGNVSSRNRSVKVYDDFKERYASHFTASLSDINPWWFDYSKGREYYRMGSNALAESNLRLLQWRQTPLIFSIKTLWMLMIIKFVSFTKQP